MKITDFKETNITFAKDQSEYQPLPAHKSKDGVVTACWELADEDILEICKNRKVYVQLLTFNAPLQPQIVSIFKPELENNYGLD